MLISEKKKFIFYHVYKVAGMSVRDALIPYCSKKQVLLQNIHYASWVLGVNINMAPIYHFHPKLVDISNYMGDSFDSYYRFAFVRHPLDWQKSLYFFMLKNKRHHQHHMVKEMSFERYLRWRIDNEIRLMSDLVSDEEGNLLLTDIYRFENINEEFERLCKRIDINGALLHKNKAGLGKDVDLSDDLYAEFREKFTKDFTNFGYN